MASPLNKFNARILPLIDLTAYLSAAQIYHY